MRVVIAGSSGVLGRRLVRMLSEQGHEVLGLTRSDTGDTTVRERGGTPIRASLFDPDEIAAGVERADAIIHAATRIPTKQRASAEDWAENDRIRVEGMKSLAEVAGRTGAEHVIFQSIVWVARPDDQSAFDEDTPANPDHVTQSAADGERITFDAAAQHGFTPTVLRGGWFYAPDAWHTRTFGESLRKRMLPVVGSGEACWSLIHADDAASAYVVALEQRPEGIYHVVDDAPVRVRDFFTYFAERQGAKPPMRVPVWLAKLAAGSYAAEFATTSMITNAKRFKRATGWEPQYPTFREGLDQVVSEWEKGNA